MGNSGLAAKGSTAVMARRREPPGALDYFPTPPWATRALFRHVLPAIGTDAISNVWEPACGEGHMAAVIAEFVGSSVTASDIFNYSYGITPVDFLNDPHLLCPAWIITNPPFSTACEFTLRALDLATEGVAKVKRVTAADIPFLSSAERRKWAERAIKEGKVFEYVSGRWP
jgi:hypothetical protein